MDCPGQLTDFTSLGDGTVTFYYEVVHSLTEGQSILCGRLESDDESWIAFGVSPNGMMAGGEAVLGLPDDGTVQKFALANARVQLMDAEYQTLMQNNITQVDGKTVMEFAKYLKEDGENEILADGENTFLWAVGTSNVLGYHAERDSFTLDFDTTRKPSTSTTSYPTFGSEEEGVSSGLIRTVSPTGGAPRRDPPPSATPAPAAPTPENTPAPVAPAVPDPIPPATPSGATTRRKIGTMVAGAGAAAFWIGM